MKKSYLLIGASFGIGLQLANDLLEQNDQVIAICRSKGDLPDAVEFYEADVVNWDKDLPNIDKKLDGIVYLPGSIDLKPFKQLKIDDFRSDMEINYFGAIRVLQKYLERLDSEPSSSVVLVSSIAATTGLPYHGSVGSAKAAVEGLGRSLAAELAPKIRVNIVAPSLTETRLSKKLINSDAKKDNFIKLHPMQAIGTPKDIASAILYLLKDGSSWITGQVFHVDGGLSTLRG